MKVGGPVIQHAGSTKYGQWLYAFMRLCVLLHVSQWFLCINVTVCVPVTHQLLHNLGESEHFHEAGFDAYCCGYGELCHMMSHDSV